MINFIVEIEDENTGGTVYSKGSNVLSNTMDAMRDIVKDIETGAPSDYSATISLIEYTGDVLDDGRVLASFEGVGRDLNAGQS